MNEKAKKHLSSAAVGTLLGGIGTGLYLGLSPITIVFGCMVGFIVSTIVLTILFK